LKEFSTVDDIVALFHNDIHISDDAIQRFSQQLATFDDKLHTIADRILQPHQIKNCENSDDASQDLCDRLWTSKAIDLHVLHELPSKDVVTQLLELESRAVERHHFPGFRHKELTALPGGLEALQILYDVLMAQPILSSLKSLWKKIFLSEASVAMLHDGFWWSFIDRFEHSRVIERSRLFDRLADTFVAFCYSISRDIKDKVLVTFSDYLAQSIYTVYSRAFPASVHHFNDSFKQYLINISYKWISGVQPSAGTWLSWDLGRLEQRDAVTDSQVAKLSALAHGSDFQSLDLEGLRTSVESLGREPSDLSEPGRTLTLTPATGTRTAVVSRQREPTNLVATLWKSQESHPTGRGAELERVLFNTSGRSVLVSHFLRMRQLNGSSVTADDGAGFGGRGKVLRTHVAKLPPSDALTYRDSVHKIWQRHQHRTRRYYQRQSKLSSSKLSCDVERLQSETEQRIAKLHNELNAPGTSPLLPLSDDLSSDSSDHELST
jgi:hypothetical protein